MNKLKYCVGCNCVLLSKLIRRNCFEAYYELYMSRYVLHQNSGGHHSAQTGVGILLISSFWQCHYSEG
jgi:hypothetical protein